MIDPIVYSAEGTDDEISGASAFHIFPQLRRVPDSVRTNKLSASELERQAILASNKWDSWYGHDFASLRAGKNRCNYAVSADLCDLKSSAVAHAFIAINVS